MLPGKLKYFISNYLVSLVFISITFFAFYLGADVANAQAPKPYVPCEDVRPDAWPPSNWFEKEFHSLRPYQASPCEIPIVEEEQALLCGNDLIVKDTFTVPPPQPIRCYPWCCGCETRCYFEVDREFIVSIDAYESELPIAGNTELIEGGTTEWPQNAWRLARQSEYKEAFDEHLPPIIEDYDDFFEYYVAYEEWRGKRCHWITIPLINKEVFLCWDDPTRPNFWAALFPYIPYSSTEDRIGKMVAQENLSLLATNIDDFDPQPPPETIWREPKERYDEHGDTLEYWESALYFPHMEENVELTSLLQTTYLPPEILEEPQPVDESIVEEVNKGPQCKIVNVRYNPGDQLFGERENGDSGLGVPVSDNKYTAKFECQCKMAPGIPGLCPAISCCTKWASFYTTIDTYSPMVEELWSKTVVGNASILKKIYPKIEPGAPIEKIEDIPAVTDAIPYTDVELLSPDPAELYFPHFGSIYDYFLHDIQTMLRPKGFAAQPANLTKDDYISEIDRLNEYVSWYLNGTIYRAESDPLSNEPEDIDKVINYSGPLNRLLSQHSQWRNEFKLDSVSYPDYQDESFKLGRAIQPLEDEDKARATRHNQVVACTQSVSLTVLSIDVTLGGYPIACNPASMSEKPSSAGNQPGLPGQPGQPVLPGPPLPPPAPVPPPINNPLWQI